MWGLPSIYLFFAEFSKFNNTGAYIFYSMDYMTLDYMFN